MRSLCVAGGIAGALTVLGIVPSASAAELVFHPCSNTPDFECSTLSVPLDPGGAQPGTLSVEVQRLVETRDAPDVLVALAGGPGQSSTRFIADFAEVLVAGLEDRQLVVVDQRGTGDSGALRCRALDQAPSVVGARKLAARVGRCGEQLGASRRWYTTTQVVEDLDAVRDALGVERISVFGISYGAYVAQRYARRFPQRVDRLVLDSPVAQGQGGAFDRSSYSAAGRALSRVCDGGRCRGITNDPEADLRRLAERLARRPVRGRVFNRRGRSVGLRLRRQAQLFDLVVSSDFSPALRAALPAAVRSALRGDGAPLLRLLALDEGTADPREFDEQNEDVREFSNALFFTTTCQEKPLPWITSEAPLSGRRALRRAALDALSPRAFRPFGHAAAESLQVGSAFCERWPVTPAAPAPKPGPIDAPALVLSGLTDVRTPPAEARRTAAMISDVSLVRVPGAAHSLVSSRLPCVEVALTRFFSDRAVGNPCAGLTGRRSAPEPAPVAPRRLNQLERHGLSGGYGRAFSAALATVRDAMGVLAIQGVLDGRFAFGGLRGGHVCAAPGEASASGRRSVLLAFHGDRYLPNVGVSGRVVVRGGTIARMRLSTASHAPARLRLSNRHLSVRMHGRTIQTRVRARHLATPSPAVASALASVRRSCR